MDDDCDEEEEVNQPKTKSLKLWVFLQQVQIIPAKPGLLPTSH